MIEFNEKSRENKTGNLTDERTLSYNDPVNVPTMLWAVIVVMRFAVACHVPLIYAYAINRKRGGLPVYSAELEHPPPPGHTPQTHSLHDRTQLKFSQFPRSLEHNPYPDKPRISFNEDGSFKLTIFSDIHFGENPWDTWGPEQDINTTALMETLLKMETPDYV